MIPKIPKVSLNTLGPVSAAFVNELRRQSKFFFTLSEACEIYGKGHYETSKFLSDLSKRKVIARIKSGIFILLTIGQENIQLSNWPVIAHELSGKQDYYISYYSAMRLYGMTTHSLFNVYITIKKRRHDKKINNIHYHFIYSNPKYFWGFTTYWITNQDKIYISDLERTILDGLDRPDLCGGIKEVVRGLWVINKKINWKVMLQHAKKFRSKASVKRLGFLVELLNLNPTCLIALQEIITLKKDFILLDPDGTKTGTYLSRWRIRININIEELKQGIWA